MYPLLCWLYQLPHKGGNHFQLAFISLGQCIVDSDDQIFICVHYTTSFLLSGGAGTWYNAITAPWVVFRLSCIVLWSAVMQGGLFLLLGLEPVQIIHPQCHIL